MYMYLCMYNVHVCMHLQCRVAHVGSLERQSITIHMDIASTVNCSAAAYIWRSEEIRPFSADHFHVYEVLQVLTRCFAMQHYHLYVYTCTYTCIHSLLLM